ncbi:MAG: tetraacyldisaccharide 4'-kinase [Armatimonadota bacterium]|nr:tetraacyldisaccharide 4'-kinase [Armatimonadota bacterium]
MRVEGTVNRQPSTVNFALDVISGRAKGPGPCALRVGLSFLSCIYLVGLKLFLLPYRFGIRKRRRLPCPVISVGNITFGGTGKTPTVRTIAAELAACGLHPALLSRGHGGTESGGAAIVSDGETRLLSAEQCGDEPAMLADLLPGVPVIIGKNRYKTGKSAIEQFDPGVILLDDGLQYWQLHRDLDIVLINAVEPFGYGRLMPRGALREPLSGLRRAGVIVITNSDKVSAESLTETKARISWHAPKSLVIEAIHRPFSLRDVGGEKLSLDWLRGRRVCVMCSIGVPGLFAESITSLGAEVVYRVDFPDHHLWKSREIEQIAEKALAAGAEVLVTTEKDMVKLPEVETRLPIMALDIIVEFRQPGLMDILLGVVDNVGKGF